MAKKERKQYQIPARTVLFSGLFFYIAGAALIVYLAFLSIGKVYYDYHGDDRATIEACNTYEPDRTIQTSYSTIDLIGKLITNEAERVEIQEKIGTCPYDIKRVYRVYPLLGYGFGALNVGLGVLLLSKFKQATPVKED